MDSNDSSSTKAVGERLKRLRNLAGLSRAKLAEEANVDKTSISFWEHAKRRTMSAPSAEKVIQACKKFGVDCTLQWLLTGMGQQPRLQFFQNEGDIKTNTDHLGKVSDQLTIIEDEIARFLSLSDMTVVSEITHSAMFPAFKIGDKVAGIWQKSEAVKETEFCIVMINHRLEVRCVTPSKKKNHFRLSFLAYDLTQSEPFEISDVELEKIAPILRVWRLL
jgi:transcriptional regulator with XRE-family HTH domain